MRIFILSVAMVLMPAPVFAQAEDADHRADRERTEQLNQRAAAIVEGRSDANARSLERYRDARARYERERAAWRRRVQDCEDGDYDACERR